MFEKIVKSAFEKITKDKENTETFYVLTHKKHRREIYFRRGDRRAIRFMKIKFPSFWKKVFYNSIKLGLAQPFLRRIKLPSDVGSLVFVAGQIKIFNFDKKEVISFPMPEAKEKFIENKEFQKKVGEMGYAPLVYEINKRNFFSREELAYPLRGGLSLSGSTLIDYYEEMGEKKVNSKDYIKNLKKNLEKKNIKDGYIKNILSTLEKTPLDLLITKIHGDYAEGQILERGGNILFIDFEPQINLITEDLSNAFRDEIDLLSNLEFQKTLKLYPEEVRKNIAYYLILSEIYNVTVKPFYLETAKKKIKSLMRRFS